MGASRHPVIMVYGQALGDALGLLANRTHPTLELIDRVIDVGWHLVGGVDVALSVDQPHPLLLSTRVGHTARTRFSGRTTLGQLQGTYLTDVGDGPTLSQAVLADALLHGFIQQ
jgi:hypothetical protein